MSRTKTLTIQEIIATPMSELRFRHFACLKVGDRDQFPPLRHARLRQLVPDSGIVCVTLDYDGSAISSCLLAGGAVQSLAKAIQFREAAEHCGLRVEFQINKVHLVFMLSCQENLARLSAVPCCITPVKFISIDVIMATIRNSFVQTLFFVINSCDCPSR